MKKILMSKITFILSLLVISGELHAQTVYTHSVTTIEGVNKPLTAYQGKKILVITLPVQQNASNDSLLHSLDSLNTAYNGSLLIIATPSYEDGYLPQNKTALKQWYRSILSNTIIVTDGYYTRKTSGSQQQGLFKWLTSKDSNNHFDQDVAGPGNKFIIWTDGALVGILNVQTRVGGATLHNLLQD